MVRNNIKTCGSWTVLALVLLILAGCASAPQPRGPEPTAPVVNPPPAAEPQRRAPRLGLALGGGAARGFAHVGVIQVLERNGIRPDLVVGTSAGSLVAALYASGMDGAALERAALSMDEATLTDWMLPLVNRGMLRGDALARYVREAVGGGRACCSAVGMRPRRCGPPARCRACLRRWKLPGASTWMVDWSRRCR